MEKALIKNIGSSIKSHTKNYFSSQAERFKKWVNNLTLKKVLLGILDFYNPLNFLRFLKKEFKQNKIIFACLLVLSAFMIAPTVFADFDLIRLDSSDLINKTFNLRELLLLPGGTYSAATTNQVGMALYMKATQFHSYLLPFGIALTTGYWMIGFGETLIGRDHSFETISLAIIKLVFYVAIVANSEVICYRLVDFGNALTDFTKSHMTGRVTASVSVIDILGLTGTTLLVPISSLLNFLIPLLILFLGSIVAYVVVWLVCLSRILKVYIMWAFSPIGCADLNGGLHSAGASYIRSFCSYCLQGAIMIAITSLGLLMLNAVLDPSNWYLHVTSPTTYISNDGLLDGMTLLAILATMCGALTKSEQLAKLLVGAH